MIMFSLYQLGETATDPNDPEPWKLLNIFDFYFANIETKDSKISCVCVVVVCVGNRSRQVCVRAEVRSEPQGWCLLILTTSRHHRELELASSQLSPSPLCPPSTLTSLFSAFSVFSLPPSSSAFTPSSPPGCGWRQPCCRERRGELEASRQFDFSGSSASRSCTETRSWEGSSRNDSGWLEFRRRLVQTDRLEEMDNSQNWF